MILTQEKMLLKKYYCDRTDQAKLDEYVGSSRSYRPNKEKKTRNFFVLPPPRKNRFQPKPCIRTDLPEKPCRLKFCSSVFTCLPSPNLLLIFTRDHKETLIHFKTGKGIVFGSNLLFKTGHASAFAAFRSTPAGPPRKKKTLLSKPQFSEQFFLKQKLRVSSI